MWPGLNSYAGRMVSLPASGILLWALPKEIKPLQNRNAVIANTSLRSDLGRRCNFREQNGPFIANRECLESLPGIFLHG